MSFQRAEGFRLFHRIVDTLLMRTVRRSTVSIGLSLVLNYTTKISRMRPLYGPKGTNAGVRSEASVKGS